MHRCVEAFILLALQSETKSFSTCAWVSDLVHVIRRVDLDRLGHPEFRRLCERVLKGGDGFTNMVEEAKEALGPRIRKDTHWDDVQGIRPT